MSALRMPLPQDDDRPGDQYPSHVGGRVTRVPGTPRNPRPLDEFGERGVDQRQPHCDPPGQSGPQSDGRDEPEGGEVDEAVEPDLVGSGRSRPGTGDVPQGREETRSVPDVGGVEDPALHGQEHHPHDDTAPAHGHSVPPAQGPRPGSTRRPSAPESCPDHRPWITAAGSTHRITAAGSPPSDHHRGITAPGPRPGTATGTVQTTTRTGGRPPPVSGRRGLRDLLDGVAQGRRELLVALLGGEALEQGTGEGGDEPGVAGQPFARLVA